MDSGLFILRYRHPQKKMPIFWFGGPNPSQPEIRRVTIFRFIFYPSTQPKKTYLNYDQIGDRLFWPALPRAEVQMDGEAYYQSRFWHD